MRSLDSRSQRGGQVIVMLSLSMVVLFGMLGLVVDLGWSYFTHKAAQAAADAAALAAVRQAMANAPNDNLRCGITGVGCAATPANCSAISGTNLQSACLYAERHGFSATNPRDTITVQAWDRTSTPTVTDNCGQGGAAVRRPPTAGCVDTSYWVTVRVSRSLPQLFSAVLGNTLATAAATATAAVTDSEPDASIWALNRQNEVPVVGRGARGNDIYVWGGSEIRAGGIVLASTSTGEGRTDEAGVVGGAGRVYGTTSIRGSGWVNEETKFIPPPTNGFPDLPIFDDPMRGKGQPPAPQNLPNIPVPNNDLAAVCGSVCQPGNYYVTRNGQATGEPILANGPIRFGSGGAGFGNYVFFGGLQVQGSVTFSPGRYILAGTTSEYILRLPNNAIMTDDTPMSSAGTSIPNTDPGEIFIFTDANYPGLQVPAAVQPIRSNLRFGQIYIQSGNKFEMNLHGLNADHPNLPEELKTFAPTVFWQDQRNSPIKYDSKGYVDYKSCGGGRSLDDPCPNNDPNINPGMILQASPKLLLYGLIYQPRGAGIEFQGNAHIISPLQIVTGSLSLQGGNTLELPGISNRLRRKVVALVN
ncbi:MAG: hypothetical protein K6T61_07645 [Bryobacteraceae bacterium]|nr:hypothetical protein [Bryobacteraceae bacterium]